MGWASGIMLLAVRMLNRTVCKRVSGMSYDVNRLRGTHPPACTCVECTRRRNRRRGGGGGGGRRFGCLPFLLSLTCVSVATALLSALV